MDTLRSIQKTKIVMVYANKDKWGLVGVYLRNPNQEVLEAIAEHGGIPVRDSHTEGIFGGIHCLVKEDWIWEDQEPRYCVSDYDEVLDFGEHAFFPQLVIPSNPPQVVGYYTGEQIEKDEDGDRRETYTILVKATVEL